MRLRERRETGEQDLFRARLDQIIDMKHSPVKLAHAIDWRFLEGQFGAVYTDGSGRPPLPTRRTEFYAALITSPRGPDFLFSGEITSETAKPCPHDRSSVSSMERL